jgi:2',3'-cyclic-nucleotide 2'-phosphodiesterase (5'-nucleotidase family)
VIGLKFLTVSTTVARYVGALRNQVDIIIVLSHIGYHGDMVLAGIVKNIDVIVGGHSHTRAERPTLIGKTIIVQAWEHGKALGVLDLTLNEGKIINVAGHLEEIRPAALKKDRAVSAIVDKYNKKVHAALDEIIGKTEVDLDGENARKKETNFGNLVADSIRHATGAQVAIINGGSIKMSIPKGKISIYDIYSALPFDNYAIAVTMNGKQIKEALEHGVSLSDQEDGGFPQVSGLEFTYSGSVEKGSRIKEIHVEGRPIEPDKYYSVATNDFLAAGGDGYKLFNDVIRSSKNYSYSGGTITGRSLIFNDPGRWIRDLLIEYIKNAKKIAPVAEGRIVELK